MKLGYPCINRSIGCLASATFRLASYSEERLVETVGANLNCLGKVLQYNACHGFRYFRVSSDLVPFASHPVCRYDWAAHFRPELQRLGRLVRDHGMRITMHPDQFVVLNGPDQELTQRNVRELEYHAVVLDAMGLDLTARIQLHVGGVYGDRTAALRRFADAWHALPAAVRRRLAVENDDRLYGLSDCLALSRETGVPVVLDSFHHACRNAGESLAEAVAQAAATWSADRGSLLVDYSSQKPGGRVGQHAERLDQEHFQDFVRTTHGWDFDLMLEIKDKEASALVAQRLLRAAGRLPDVEPVLGAPSSQPSSSPSTPGLCG
jgi:UV DNA damage endonuclease